MLFIFCQLHFVIRNVFVIPEMFSLIFKVFSSNSVSTILGNLLNAILGCNMKYIALLSTNQSADFFCMLAIR